MTHHAQLPIWDDKSDSQKIETLRQMVLDLYAYTLDGANAHLLAILAEATPYDEMEAAHIATMQQLIRAHPNILAQNCEVGHITGSALVIDNQGRALLHLHKYLNLWLPLGGHGDTETDPAQIALREAFEESGLSDLRHFPESVYPRPLDFDVHTIPQSKDRPEHLHLDWRYVLRTDTPESLQPDPDESLDFRWLPLEDILQLDDVLPDVKRIIHKVLPLITKIR